MGVLAEATPADIVTWQAGWTPPDIIEFVRSDRYLNRPQLYPRQATLLKVWALQTELLTPYDEFVIEQWIKRFKRSGDNGIQPDISQRIQMCRDEGRPWFWLTCLVSGRRGSKGYLGGLVGAYVTWTFMGKADPQAHYGIARDKAMASLVFAAKKQQARDEQWRDIYNVIVRAPCFAPWISRPMTESLSLFAPHDKAAMWEMERRGIAPAADPATFHIEPRPSTATSGRGPASYHLAFDEMAHLVAPGSTVAAQETFAQAEPSLGQFGTDGCVWAASSPWEMTGKFFELYEDALEREDDRPVYPHYLMGQFTSWDLYEDYQLAGDLGLGPIERPIVSYDRDMKRLERANPQTFAVERRARFATVQDAYLDAKKVLAMFQPWPSADREWVQQTKGRFNVHYFSHGDPAEVGKRFGFAIAHVEVDPADPTIKHVVFDVIHAWDPADYPDHELPWLEIEVELADFAAAFLPDSMTFDAAMPLRSIQFLRGELRRRNLPKRVEVYKRPSTAELDWRRWEALKLSIGMNWVHAPPGGASDIAELELRFLQSPRPGKVKHPDIGPVQTKDVADTISEVCWALIGEQAEETKRMLSDTPLVATTSTSGPTERTEGSSLSGFHSRATRRGQARMRRRRR